MRKPLRDPRGPPPTSRLARLFEVKVTPGVVALFLLALAVMCAAGAGIGVLANGMQHPEVRR